MELKNATDFEAVRKCLRKISKFIQSEL